MKRRVRLSQHWLYSYQTCEVKQFADRKCNISDKIVTSNLVLIVARVQSKNSLVPERRRMVKILIHFSRIMVNLHQLSRVHTLGIWTLPEEIFIKRLDSAPCINVTRGESYLYVCTMPPFSKWHFWKCYILTNVSAIMHF